MNFFDKFSQNEKFLSKQLKTKRINYDSDDEAKDLNIDFPLLGSRSKGPSLNSRASHSVREKKSEGSFSQSQNSNFSINDKLSYMSEMCARDHPQIRMSNPEKPKPALSEKPTDEVTDLISCSGDSSRLQIPSLVVSSN